MSISSRPSKNLIYNKRPNINLVEDYVDVVVQAQLMAVLFALHNASPEDLKVQSSQAMFTKIKARLVLLANANISGYQKWLKKDIKHFKEYIYQLHMDYNKDLWNKITGSYSMLNNLSTAEEVRHLESICNAMADDYFTKFTDHVKFKNTLMPGVGIYEFEIAHEDIQEFKVKLFNKICEIYSSLIGGNFTILASITSPYELVNELLTNFHFENNIHFLHMQFDEDFVLTGLNTNNNYSAEIIELKKMYDNFRLDYLLLLKEVAAEFPGVDFSGFVKSSVDNLFDTFENYPCVYYRTFVLQLSLQFIRFPKFHNEFFQILNNLYLEHAEYTHEGFMGLMNVLVDTKENMHDTHSLEQLLNINYLALFSHENTAQLGRFINENNSTFIAGAKLNLAADFDLTPVVSITPLNLFPAGVPGGITVADIDYLANEFSFIDNLINEFDDFSTDSVVENDDTDRVQARDTFLAKINQVQSIEEMSALVLVAKPYVNRHRSKINGLNTGNTETWKNAVADARNKALSLVTSKADVLPPATAIEMLEIALKQPLFVEHRNTFGLFFIATWGNTSTQNLLEQKLAGIKAELNRPSISRAYS